MKDYDGKDFDIQAVTPADIRSAYSGKARHCMCGCAGKHYYASAHRAEGSANRGYPVQDDEVDDRMIVRVLRLIQANEDGEEAWADPNATYAEATVGKRSYVVYFTDAFILRRQGR